MGWNMYGGRTPHHTVNMWLAMANASGSFWRRCSRLSPCRSVRIAGLHLLGFALCLASTVEGVIPSPPRNLTLVPPVLSQKAKIRWLPGDPRDNLTDYLIVNRADGSDTKTVSRIDPEYTSFLLKDLKEETTYVVYVKAAAGSLLSKGSATLEFTTPVSEGLHRTFTTNGADLVIVGMVMALWFGALSLFIRTWKKKMSSTTVTAASGGGAGGAGTPMRFRSRYRKPWMWSQKYRLGRGYPAT